MCCWNYLIEFWCFAADQVSGIVDARTTDKNTVGMMMTKVGGEKNHEGEE